VDLLHQRPVLSARHLPESRSPDASGTTDYLGAAAVVVFLSAYLHPDALAAGFQTAVLISGALCAAGGLLAAVTITNPAREHRDATVSEQCLHCGLDAPPLTASSDRRILAIQPRG
jgi:hypothetical protein